MSNSLSLCCANCGTQLEAPAQGALGVTCPVCHFFNTFSPGYSEPKLTREVFEARLGELVATARVGTLSADVIVEVLRDELEFAAELANRGRDLCVQIVDLGPRVGEPVRRTSGDNSVLLRGRVAGE
jgi:phage FluMu protein Com